LYNYGIRRFFKYFLLIKVKNSGNSEKQKVLGVIKKNPLFLHEIEWKNNGFFFTTPNMLVVGK